MALKMLMFAFVLLVSGRAACDAYNISGPELTQRLEFSSSALEYDYPATSLYSNSLAGQTYTMDMNTNPILTTLPAPGLSGKIDDFAPCSIKIPHVHPRASKFSYVASGTLTVGIAEEDGGRILNFTVPTGSAIVVPQGLIHFMKNENCTSSLKMVTVFNNVDAGELTLLDKILGFDTDTARAATGLDEATLTLVRNSLPQGPGDLRVDPVCQATCGLASAPTATMASSTAGK